MIVLIRHVTICCFVSQETIKQLQEEVSCVEEAQCVFRTFSDWLSTAQHGLSSLAVSVDVVDRFAMERKMKKLEVDVVKQAPKRSDNLWNIAQM